jgi:hypothetical protein
LKATGLAAAAVGLATPQLEKLGDLNFTLT